MHMPARVAAQHAMPMMQRCASAALVGSRQSKVAGCNNTCETWLNSLTRCCRLCTADPPPLRNTAMALEDAAADVQAEMAKLQRKIKKFTAAGDTDKVQKLEKKLAKLQKQGGAAGESHAWRGAPRCTLHTLSS